MQIVYIWYCACGTDAKRLNWWLWLLCRLTGLVPDDYTTLASILVVDACLRVRLLDEAVETYEVAFNRGVFLDLPAYDALLQALVRSDRTLEAVAILNEIADEDDVAPTEHSYLPMLMALVGEGEYENASDLLEKGQGRGVLFTGEVRLTSQACVHDCSNRTQELTRLWRMLMIQTFHPLVDRVSRVEEPTDALVMLLTYIEDIWEDAKVSLVVRFCIRVRRYSYLSGTLTRVLMYSWWRRGSSSMSLRA